MRCAAPIQIRHPESRLLSEVACGQCRSCRLRRKLAWVGRLRLEYQCHEFSRWVTLKYRDDPGVLNPDDLSEFMKRYRYHYGPCRFFGVGEYGEKRGRGHFHVIIFGHAPVVVGPWRGNKAWDKGFSSDGTITPASIAYTAGYCLKGNIGDKDRQPFIRCSLRPGLGFAVIQEFARKAPKDLEVWPSSYRIGAQQYPLCQGGLAAFKVAYLESGGLPPFNCSPVGRDLRARASWLDWGTHSLQSSVSQALWRREDGDSSALPSRR